MEEFDIALNTGMRKSEQYTTEWIQIFFKRKRVKLDGTKNGSNREIPMNKTCLSAYQQLHKRRPKMGVCTNQNSVRISTIQDHGLIAVLKIRE
jgi:site-specific recombinase XerD